MSKQRRTISILLPLAIVGIGVVLGGILVLTGPTTSADEKVSAVTIVRTMALSPRTESVSVAAYGPIIPARRVTIEPQVSGQVIHYHEALVPGGFIGEGEELVAIDPSDYELELAEHESALEQALFELEVEKGRQVVAQREWQLLESDLMESEVNQSLVLRKPHLRRTEAMIRSATNEIARAELALSRTSVTSPFNAMVLDEVIEQGQLVQAGSEIATLVGTDEFWVQATLPMAELRRIQLPGPGQPGASATVYLDAGNGHLVAWPGTVVRLLSDLEPTGRMARVLISVKDPLGLSGDGSKLPLLLGSYVRAEVDAGTLTNILVIPRSALREGERIWVVDDENSLHIRDTEILWTRPDTVIIANVINAGEQLVISGVRTALPGMKVNPQSDAPTSAEEKPQRPTNTTAPGGLSATVPQ